MYIYITNSCRSLSAIICKCMRCSCSALSSLSCCCWRTAWCSGPWLQNCWGFCCFECSDVGTANMLWRMSSGDSETHLEHCVCLMLQMFRLSEHHNLRLVEMSFWAPMRATRKAIVTDARNGLLGNGCSQGTGQISDAHNLHPRCTQPL